MSGPITLPWPSAVLSGHAKGSRFGKSAATKKHRAWAFNATKAAGAFALPSAGDIAIHIRFTPPNLRGDRVNFPNRVKPYLDGIAEALGVNDARFLPTYSFGEPVKGGAVVVSVVGA